MATRRNDRVLVAYHAWRSACAAYDLCQMLAISDDDKATVSALLKDAGSQLHSYYEQELDDAISPSPVL